jgi:hypothetical protein
MNFFQTSVDKFFSNLPKMCTRVRLDRCKYTSPFLHIRTRRCHILLLFCLRKTCFLFLVSSEYRIDNTKHPSTSFFSRSKLEVWKYSCYRRCVSNPFYLYRGALHLPRLGALTYYRGPQLELFCLTDRVKAFFKRPLREIFFPCLPPSHYFTTTRLSTQVQITPDLLTRRLLYIN